MATSGSTSPEGQLCPVLGLAEEASNDEIADAYRRLRAHVETRARGAVDPQRRSRYETELEILARQFAARGFGKAPVDEPRAARFDPPAWLRRWAARVAWAAIGALALAIGLGVAALLGREPAPPAPARISVVADPIGASAELLAAGDEHVVASGPADGAPLDAPEGRYILRVRHGDCPEIWTRDLSLTSGEQREFAPVLCQGEGRLVIRSNVSEDRALVDGTDVGHTGSAIHSLRVGGHDVEVRKQGYRTWTGRVVVRPDEEITLHAELEPESEPGAAAAESPKPPGATAGAQAAAPPAPPPGAPPTPSAPPAQSERSVTGGPGGGQPPPPRTGKGGSKSWHDAIKSGLVADFDRNGSRSLDTPEEVQSIPCSRWQSIESSYETGGLAVDMSHLYGFDGSSAPANTLGITQAMRGYTYDRMKQCGLKTRR